MNLLHPGAAAPFPPFALPGVDCSACHPESHTLCSCGALCDAHRKAIA